MTGKEKIIAKHYTIRGLVQGVGFRPFIYRLATGFNLNGWVKNSNEAVFVYLEGFTEQFLQFEKELTITNPPASKIFSVQTDIVKVEGYSNFTIAPSENISNEITQISPDIAVCNDCLDDMLNQPHRINYPLVNCCHCGPRFTITRALPYDRKNTTMDIFPMCPECKKEYEDPSDRRFHAQPVACNHCGPKYVLYKSENRQNKPAINITGLSEIISELRTGLGKGKIYAFKATGGYNLVCNAMDDEAVARLRQIKHRDTKPFAVMFKDLDTLKSFLHVNPAEETELLSFRRPIVILREKAPLAKTVSLGLGTVGAMLSYMPFHFMLFHQTGIEALVMTSGNISDEPILIDDKKAIQTFISVTDGVLAYNRDIFNRVDDSVEMVVNERSYLIRRSRGYVPQPVELKINTEGILATGAELTGTFCIGKGKEAILSQYLGDLQNFENYNFYTESYNRFKELFRFQPEIVVTDLHPDYVTTSFAKQLNLKLISVQHHHAHVASVMAEHNLSGPVLGVAFDGTGYGTDGNIWGSEFLICKETGFERLAHFDYIPLPGGDKAVLEPWRSALAYLYRAFGKEVLEIEIPFIQNIDKRKAALLVEAIDKNINCPLSCSTGRLFDAISALTGICNNPTFHAEAPMRLEACIDPLIDDSYTYELNNNIISLQPVIRAIVNDLKQGTPVSTISARFHNTIVALILNIAIQTREKSGKNQIALSGGTFQNRYLLEKAENILIKNMFEVYTNRQVPANDGGISLGQMYLAAQLRNV